MIGRLVLGSPWGKLPYHERGIIFGCDLLYDPVNELSNEEGKHWFKGKTEKALGSVMSLSHQIMKL